MRFGLLITIKLFGHVLWYNSLEDQNMYETTPWEVDPN